LGWGIFVRIVLGLNETDMATFKHFEEILAWQKAREFCKKIKLLTDKPEFSRDYKL
jgi:hypothetical protein